ncbi:protein phosphatase 4, regulatory subunit 2 [Mortierella alpina]|uniref:Protein phosphatase 4, regulatory subunit 2 n=1 Tax=Mortierella alpina TaxID=64518 RepID=A0A9P6LZ65_MORAP|nr:protein phosphatase 4, regulatory subunit 2 [Mortierella alpina]
MTEQQTTAPLDKDSLIQDIALTNQVSVSWEELRQALKERLDQVFESKQLIYTASTVTNPLTTTLAPLPPTSTEGDATDPTSTSTSEPTIRDTSSVQDHSQDQVPEQSDEDGLKSEQDLDSSAAGTKDGGQSNQGHTAVSSEAEAAQGQAEGQTPMPASVEQEEEAKTSHGPETGDLNGASPFSIVATEQAAALNSNMVPISKDTLLVETPEGYHERINGLLDAFTSAPFTIQRVCELLSNPTEHHSNLIKYLRAVEKVLMITSSIYEFSNPAYNGPSALDEDSADEDKPFAEGINGDYARSSDLDFSLIATSAVPPMSETSDLDGHNSAQSDNVVTGADEVHQKVSDASADKNSVGDAAEKESSADMEVDSEGTSMNGTTMDGVETAAGAEADGQETESSDIQVDADADSSMELDQAPM